MSRKNDEMDLITVPVPPQRLGWLQRQLDANRIPYQDDGRGNVTTLEMAQPIIDQVLGYQAQHKSGGFSIGGIIRSWIPFCWLVLAGAFLYAGAWPVALLAVGGAVARFMANVWVEGRYRRAEQFGDAGMIARFRKGDTLWDFMFGVGILFVAGVLVAVVAGVL